MSVYGKTTWNFPDYSAVEWQEIELSFAHLPPIDPPVARWKFLLISCPPVGDSRTSIAVAREARDEAATIQSLLKKIDDLLRPMVGEGEFCEHVWEPNQIGEKYKSARPYLLEIAQFCTKKIIISVAEEKYYSEPERREGPRHNPLKHRMLEKTAALWEKLGGTVSQSSEYERFFTAVLRPVFNSDFGRDNGLGTWPHLTFSARNDLFVKHAAAWMKARGTEGRRGPKRKKG